MRQKRPVPLVSQMEVFMGVKRIYVKTKDGFDVCSYRWSCKKHKEDLATYGVVPNKTFLLKPPYKLSEEFHLDYIRGYFDGDGSINLIKKVEIKLHQLLLIHLGRNMEQIF